ncbi:protein neprosin-like [Silene latifolia]|uniref:protein neprosin-like n=1 Tax=Silene latifolia TaxID=37657 RepID=UPI003D783DCC
MELQRTATILLILCSLFYNGVCRVPIVESNTVTSIKTKNGQVYNCIPFAKQLAFSHSSIKIEAQNNILKIQGRNHSNFGLEESCPLGTVPILDGIDAIDQQQFIPPFFQPKSHCNAVVHTKPDAAKKFFGTRASVCLYKPNVQTTQWSAGRMKLSNGPDSIEAGWMVNPTVFKDSEAHLYAKFSAGRKGCINTQCPGFVQVDTTVPLGLIPETYSQIQGVKWTWDITIEKHRDDGNWWLSIFVGGGAKKIPIGYWPKSLFTSLAGVASQVEWGGEIDNPGIKEPQPDMGSGKKAHYSTKLSAFFEKVTVVSENSQTLDPSDTEKYEDCIPFYNTLDDGNQGSYWGRLMYYGGTHW